MALGNGVFFSHGISIGATLSGSQIVPVYPSKATDAMRFILIVDGDGNAIVPEMIPASQGIDTGEGRIGGMKYTLPTAAEVAALTSTVSSLSSALTALTTRVEALETAEEATVVTWSASIALDWDALPTRTVEVTMPINMPNTSFTPTNMVQGVTYTLILKHPLGGLAADGLVWDTSYWVMNGVWSYNFSGDPNEGLALRFVAIDGKLVHIAGNSFAT